jgi:hypothetical protein
MLAQEILCYKYLLFPCSYTLHVNLLGNLVTNCIYCVLSAFSDNRLIVNHLYISWRILLAMLVKFVGLKLVIIMLVSPHIELLQLYH